MKNFKVPVYGTSSFLLNYLIAVQLEMSYPFIFTMFLVGQGLVVYLVYTVLKYGEDTKQKFSEGYYYSDRPQY